MNFKLVVPESGLFLFFNFLVLNEHSFYKGSQRDNRGGQAQEANKRMF